jgi:hypothetical protein
MSHTSGWIGVDLDGTLAHYDHWRGNSHIGEPICTMVERVKQWLKEGKKVKIFTARMGTLKDGSFEKIDAMKAIQTWCENHIGQRLEITATKDYAMIELWDDRCVCVERNTGKILGQNP